APLPHPGPEARQPGLTCAPLAASAGLRMMGSVAWPAQIDKTRQLDPIPEVPPRRISRRPGSALRGDAPPVRAREGAGDLQAACTITDPTRGRSCAYRGNEQS